MSYWNKREIGTYKIPLWDWWEAYSLLYRISRSAQGYTCHSYLGPGQSLELYMSTALTLEEAKRKCERDFQDVGDIVKYVQEGV